jgi:antitoxin ParD1/3/4
MPFDAILFRGGQMMASMNISLPDPMRDWVQRRIDDGHYASASDYVRDLIRHDQEQARRLSVEDIRRSIAESRESAATISADAVFDRLEARLKAMVE